MTNICLLEVLALFAALTGCSKRANQQISFDPSTYTELSTNEVVSLDPAWAIDDGSLEIIDNVYETLFTFDRASTTKLIPLLARQLPSRENGLISADGRTYIIPIRKDATFQDGTPMTAEDVRYSFLRFILEDRAAGPSSTLLEPLLGTSTTRDDNNKIKPRIFEAAKTAVEVRGDKVVLHLTKPYAPLLAILASWMHVVSKDWASKNGDWDGTEANWMRFNNPQNQTSPFSMRMNGTGPFRLSRWDQRTHEVVLERNDHYRMPTAKLKSVFIKFVDEFQNRKLQLAAGDADSICAGQKYWSQVKDLPHVKFINDLLAPGMEQALFFTFRINPTANPFIGSGKLDGRGIPPDFFSELNVRKAFAHAFDYQGFIQDVMHGKGVQPTGGIPEGMLGYNPHQQQYEYDTEKAKACFKKAYDGKLWTTGFKFTAVYTSGSSGQQTILQMLKRSIESLNPKFNIEIRPLNSAAFLDVSSASKLPIVISALYASYPDPHDFAFSLLNSHGYFPSTQHYANPAIDKLIAQALAEIDPRKRTKIYWKMQELEYADVPHLLILKGVFFRIQRDWVKGWYYNPFFPSAPCGCNYYPIYKEAPPILAGSSAATK